jgi:RNA polymerase sigma-70 factor, ECF subfamily
MNNHSKRYFELILKIMKDLERFSVFLTRNKERAKDLLNDSILEGHDSFKNLKSEKAFLSYMFTIISRTYKRNEKRNLRFLPLNDDLPNNIYSKSMSSVDLLDIKMLYSLIDTLSENDKILIILSELMELKHKEIAEIMNLSVSNVKVGVFRAKKKLEKLFNESKGINLLNNKSNLLNLEKYENFIKLANEQQN